MKVIKFRNKFYKQTNDIYIKSFPKEERYLSLNNMIKADSTDLYCLVENESVYGIIYLIENKSSIFILYLAINTDNRSKGYGSYLLKWCLNKYKDKKIFLNIEELNEEKSDLKIRKKRLDFYLRNGFYLTNIMSKDDKENFHVLSNQKNVNLDEYIELDNFVAKVLNETISNIVEIDLNKINFAQLVMKIIIKNSKRRER